LGGGILRRAVERAREDIRRAGAPARANAAARARALGLFLLVIAGALAALVWWTRATRDPHSEPAPAADTREARPPYAADLDAAQAAGGDSASGLGQSDAERAAELAPTRPRGARIRGFADTEAGLEFPRRWTLVLEPARALIGDEPAQPRRVEFENGEQDFSVDGLPLAAYELRAEADGMNGRPVSVVLQRGSADPYVQLVLTRSGAIDGYVLEEGGAPVVGLAIVLESLPGGLRRDTATDAAGRYVFERVLDGEYRLHYGAPESPIAPARELLFQAPSLRVPERRVGALSELVVRVLDDRGQPVSGASISGSGTQGGLVLGESDATGELRTRFLPAGRYRVRAQSAVFGEAFGTIELERGTHAALELSLE